VEDPDSRALPYLYPDNEILRGWSATLSQGECVRRCQNGMSEQEWLFLQPFGIKAVYIVPIFTRQTYWGAVALQSLADGRHFEDSNLELLQSAARFNTTLFNEAPIGIAVFDEDDVCVDCNETLLRMVGVDRQYFCSHFYSLLPEKFRPGGEKSQDVSKEMTRRALAGERVVEEWVLRTPAGELIPCEITVVSAPRDGKLYVLAYFYDLRHLESLKKDVAELAMDRGMSRIWKRAYDNLKKKSGTDINIIVASDDKPPE
jgi:PAS domain S-box-containing protein